MKMKIAVIGLGYVGMTVVGAAAGMGHEVYGYDLDQNRVNKVQSMIMQNEYQLDGYLLFTLRDNVQNIHLSTSYDEELKAVDAKFVCVDTINVVSAIQMLAPFIKRDDAIIIESTVAINMPTVIKEMLLMETGFEPDTEFTLAFVPERVMEGRLLQNFESMPRAIGTYNPKSFNRVKKIYTILGVNGKMIYTDPYHAVASKDFENAFRFLEISISNEFADICRESHLDFNTIRKLVNVKGRYMGYNELLQSGIGIGGSCIPMAADIVAKMNWENANLTRTAIELNLGRKESIAHAIDAMLRTTLGSLENKKIAIFGATYRPNGADIRDSPAIDIITKLSAMIVPIYIYDPLWPNGGNTVQRVLPTDEEFDAVVILVGHDAFRDLSMVKSKFFLDLTGIVKKYPKRAKRKRLQV
jgi:UDP-N-acetyl-D-mannosaminuronic acid dehydrogenase